MKTKTFIFFFSLLTPAFLQAQQKTIHSNLLWAGYYNTLYFKNFSLVSDVQLRTTNWADKWSQLLIRSGLNYSFNDRFALTGGFAFFKNAQYEGKELLLKNEWRPWQEFSYQVKINKINLTQRLRAEQRFLQQVEDQKKLNSYEYIFRLRYKINWQFPLQHDKIRLLIANEIMVNPGYICNQRFFDQNRSIAGLSLKLNSTTMLECQYLKIFQWHSSTSILDNQNVLRVNINQQFNLKNHD